MCRKCYNMNGIDYTYKFVYDSDKVYIFTKISVTVNELESIVHKIFDGIGLKTKDLNLKYGNSQLSNKSHRAYYRRGWNCVHYLAYTKMPTTSKKSTGDALNNQTIKKMISELKTALGAKSIIVEF